MMKKHRLASLVAVGLAGAFALAGCSNGDGGGEASDCAADSSALGGTPAEDTASGRDIPIEPASYTPVDSSVSSRVATADPGSKGEVTLGFLPSWTDGLSTAWLLKDQLETIGYTVEMKELTEAAVLYTGVANGEIDIYPSAWPEVTHRDYMDKYGDKLEDLGAYYDNAVLTIAVPEYTKIDSIADLAGCGEHFDGEIIGIEPSAGLTKQTEEEMIPKYGLDDEYKLVTSSTATMLATLEEKIDKKEDVVVTLWRPFWANDKFPVKDLKDPKGAMGETEALHFIATKGWGEANPEAAELIGGIKLDDATYGSLEDTVVNKFEKDKDKTKAIDEWIKENPDAFETELTE